MLGIAWKLQAELGRGGGRRGARGGREARAERLVPGSRLVRVWRAERHEIKVTENGYLWRDRSWASLSSVARAITGTRRNGPAFFGLRDGDVQ